MARRVSSDLELPPRPAPGTALLVGLSGGLDSTALLHLLAHTEGDVPLRAVHVHHDLHPQADAWAAHCRQVCAQLSVPLEIARVHVPRDGGEGLEAAARRARHAAFAQRLQAGEILVLGHHLDDQAETFLLRALRASGPDGLAAMRMWRRHGEGWLWRPLLATARQALSAYAQRHGLAWVEDPSNQQAEHDRNFLRLQVLPLLRTRWPDASAAFARAAQLQADVVALGEADIASALLHASTDDPHVLQIAALVGLPAPRRAQVLRHWIAALGLPALPAQGVMQIEEVLLPAPRDTRARFDWAGASIRCWGGLLHAGRHQYPLPVDWCVSWNGHPPMPLPCGGHLALESLDGEPLPHVQWTVHARRGGERITLPGRTHSHALKTVLQQMRVPPWEREHMPLLSDHDGHVLAVGDRIHSARLATWLQAHRLRLRLRWQRAPLS